VLDLLSSSPTHAVSESVRPVELRSQVVLLNELPDAGSNIDVVGMFRHDRRRKVQGQPFPNLQHGCVQHNLMDEGDTTVLPT
jgi:hypothetical protein